MSTDTACTFGALWKEELLSDFTISCKGVDFKVHRAFIIAGSTFFRSICILPFQENKENRVDLVDEETEIVARMLSFMYTGEYDDTKVPEWLSRRTFANVNSSVASPEHRVQNSGQFSESETMDSTHMIPSGGKDLEEGISTGHELRSEKPSRISPLLAMEVNTLVYACGDKFGMPSLKAAAAVKFGESISEGSKSAYFVEAVELLFDITAVDDSEIRYMLLLWCIDHAGDITSNLAETIAKHEPLSWKLAVEVKNRAKDITHAPKVVRLSRSDAEEKLFQTPEVVKTFIDKYNRQKYCKSCGIKVDGFDVRLC